MKFRSGLALLVLAVCVGCVKGYPVSPIPADVATTTLVFSSRHPSLGMQTFSSLAADIYDYGESLPESRESIFSDAYRGSLTMSSGETIASVEIPVRHHIAVVFRFMQDAQGSYRFTCSPGLWFFTESEKSYRLRYTMGQRGCATSLVDQSGMKVPTSPL